MRKLLVLLTLIVLASCGIELNGTYTTPTYRHYYPYYPYYYYSPYYYRYYSPYYRPYYRPYTPNYSRPHQHYGPRKNPPRGK